MQLGLVTYNWGKDWDLPTLIKNCEETGFAGVELRSTHKHGVEPALHAQRAEVANGCPMAGRASWLGTTCNFTRPMRPWSTEH
jgi:sugar phosphate isomerase/epimerase